MYIPSCLLLSPLLFLFLPYAFSPNLAYETLVSIHYKKEKTMTPLQNDLTRHNNNNNNLTKLIIRISGQWPSHRQRAAPSHVPTSIPTPS